MTDEAKREQTEGGLEPATEGWFVVNVREAAWWRHDAFGAGCVFEGSEDTPARFPELGINIQVWPGEPNCRARKDPESLLYPVDEVAQRHGAGVDKETPDAGEAYADFPRSRRERLGDVGPPWQ